MTLTQAHAAYNIGPDDLLRITVYGYDDLKTETRVSADGRITFPLVGNILASGKSSLELEEDIAIRLISGGFIHDAQVSVVVLEHFSQQVPVLGYVNKPGRYALDSQSSLIDLIAMAGGINELGDHKVLITRVIEDSSERIELDLRDFTEHPDIAEPFLLKQNDTVYVPKAPMFYIYGQVQRPGGYRLDTGLTVVQALSIGGGLTPRGTQRCIEIKRKDETGSLQEVEVELHDPVLKDDVIYVNERWF